ncbi:MAG: anti-sigma factor family protein [Candidatus Eisenbacteria bacterium]
MITCPQRDRLHEWLDGTLEGAVAQRFAAHLETCETCAAELAVYTRLEAMVAAARVWDPGPALTERILDHVVPSRVRRRFVTVVGWAYTAVTAASTFAFISWATRPTTPAWIADRLGQLYLAVIQTGLFTLHTLVAATLRFGDGWGLLGSFAGRAAPLLHAATVTLTEPVFAGTVVAAVASTVAVLRWMRPGGAARTDGRVEHVDLLGF